MSNTKYLIISGGSLRGIAYLGVLESFQNKYHNFLTNIKTMAGSSIGSIILLGIQIGYTIEEIKYIMINNNLSLIAPQAQSAKKNKKYSVLIKNILTTMAMDDGKAINNFIENLFIKKNINIDITFSELYKKTQQTFICTGSCISNSKCTYYSHKTTPNFSVRKAVIISTRLPFIFPPINNDNLISIDGAFFDPFPIRALEEKEIQEINKNEKTLLGIISSDIPKTYKIETTVDMIQSLLKGVSKYFMKYVTDNYKNSILCIPLDTKPGDLALSQKEKKELFIIGKNYGTKYIIDLENLPIT